MSRRVRSRESGQVLFLFVPILAILMVAAMVMFNVVMIETSAITTMDNSLRLAGIAALDARSAGSGTDAYSTWIFDETNGPGSVDCTVQRLVYENLAPQLGMFVSDPAAVTGYDPASGACGAVPTSLSIEAWTPSTPTTPSADYLNGALQQPAPACPGGITGCRAVPTIVIRLTVQIVQLGNLTWLPPGGSLTRTVVVSAGTDAP